MVQNWGIGATLDRGWSVHESDLGNEREVNSHSSKDGSLGREGWTAGRVKLSATVGKPNLRSSKLGMSWNWAYERYAGLVGTSGERDQANHTK